ncbi:MAG: 4-(cytidine 5'-diphospho)-2-C-methyl-D-erythritol kinase [Planctomycetes bacterium]|nr:4-(cytidine 5'-diphospho)-2-C-methyl-D-erythritol kinase [Planctomycetota bacterium]
MNVLKSFAKVNLGLRVLGKRPDGYHELETLMHEIDLHDTIEISSAEETSLHAPGMSSEDNCNNLVIKAYEMLKQRFPEHIKNYHFKLHKHIPLGGGLGGGSSNAICVLKFLWERDVPEGTDTKILDDLAASLGSDTNFFLQGGTALCLGRGEKIVALDNKQYFFNLLLPDFSCSTPSVFRVYAHKEQDRLGSLEDLWKKGRGLGENDLRHACLEAYPKMKQVMDSLGDSCGKIHLSGSGSTLYSYHTSMEERDEQYRLLIEGLKGSLALKVLKSQSVFRL